MALHYLLTLHIFCFLKDITQNFMALHYLLPLQTLLSDGYFSSFPACALSAAAHLASYRIFSSFHAFALSAAAAHRLVQKKRYRIHDSTGLAPQHKNQSSKVFESSSLSAA
jgi:hypothetical protein